MLKDSYMKLLNVFLVTGLAAVFLSGCATTNNIEKDRGNLLVQVGELDPELEPILDLSTYKKQDPRVGFCFYESIVEHPKSFTFPGDDVTKVHKGYALDSKNRLVRSSVRLSLRKNIVCPYYFKRKYGINFLRVHNLKEPLKDKTNVYDTGVIGSYYYEASDGEVLNLIKQALEESDKTLQELYQAALSKQKESVEKAILEYEEQKIKLDERSKRAKAYRAEIRENWDRASYAPKSVGMKVCTWNNRMGFVEGIGANLAIRLFAKAVYEGEGVFFQPGEDRFRFKVDTRSRGQVIWDNPTNWGLCEFDT